MASHLVVNLGSVQHLVKKPSRVCRSLIFKSCCAQAAGRPRAQKPRKPHPYMTQRPPSHVLAFTAAHKTPTQHACPAPLASTVCFLCDSSSTRPQATPAQLRRRRRLPKRPVRPQRPRQAPQPFSSAGSTQDAGFDTPALQSIGFRYRIPSSRPPPRPLTSPCGRLGDSDAVTVCAGLRAGGAPAEKGGVRAPQRPCATLRRVF